MMDQSLDDKHQHLWNELQILFKLLKEKLKSDENSLNL